MNKFDKLNQWIDNFDRLYLFLTVNEVGWGQKPRDVVNFLCLDL